MLSTMTLLATWFGAGTLLTASDEIYREGLSVTALEPYGAGFCLILAGIFFAKPLWEMKLLTFSDLFRKKIRAQGRVLVGSHCHSGLYRLDCRAAGSSCWVDSSVF